MVSRGLNWRGRFNFFGGQKRGVKHGSKRPVQRFKASVEHKGSVNGKRFIGNSEKGVLPDPLPKRALKILSVWLLMVLLSRLW